ncbi:PREDICTED: uncharacterized protein LOC106743398 isoform X2 [Dinoponera quadriceps]|uniref:Uncharacterized protein LOC106743398 isoform X2 n=1 Tax=Dinoponera quadriceps TaxID=609295 RepID=A0A6P3X2U2_DINQU|nr:PREDICTED: uncharacterized protein LOC106743398 isoform X2 [Dinoponera quadriceps]
MMKTYCFDKSLHERLMEYTSILSNSERILPASQIEQEWNYDTELIIEPVGWQALWNVPFSVCAQNQVHYPLVLLVEVLSTECSTLSALVKIIWDEMEKYQTFPTECTVKLIELYPTIEQINTALDVLGTAHCIDKLRFFFTYLWMPWDNEEDDNIDWVSQHLESRIKFAYDIKRGIIDKQTCDLIRSLIREGKQIWEKISKLENLISDDDEDKKLTANTTVELMNLHFRLQQIKSEMDVLENATMREMVLKYQNSVEKNIKSKDEKITCYFVWLEGTLKELRKTCDQVEEMLPNDLSIKIYGCLDETLHTCGIIKGISDARCTILHPKDLNSSSTLLDFSDSSNEVTLENVCVSLGELPIGIIVRSGVVRIKHCIISNLNSKQKIVQTGIVVMPGATLIIDNTNLEYLGTTVLICTNGKVIMNNCNIRACYLGIQLTDNSSLIANKCVFDNCLEYAIQMDTDRDIPNEARHLYYNEIPDDMSEIKLSECRSIQSSFKDIILKPKRVAAMTEWLDVNAII